MNVSRAEGVTVHDAEKCASSTISGKRIGGWLVAVVPVLALLVCGELAAEVVRLLVVGILEIVLSIRACLPDINDCSRDALLGVEVLDYAMHESHLAVWVWVADDGVAKVAEGRVRGPEGSEDCGGGRRLAGLIDVHVCDLVDKSVEKVKPATPNSEEMDLRFNTENIRNTMCLIPDVCGGLANRVYESDTLKPLLVGELNLTNEVMEMCDELAHDEPRPLWYIGADGIDDGICEVGVESMLCIRSILVLGRGLGIWVHCGICLKGIKSIRES